MKNENITRMCKYYISPISMQDSALDSVTIYASHAGSEVFFLYPKMNR